MQLMYAKAMQIIYLCPYLYINYLGSHRSSIECYNKSNLTHASCLITVAITSTDFAVFGCHGAVYSNIFERLAFTRNSVKNGFFYILYYSSKNKSPVLKQLKTSWFSWKF